MKITWLGQAGLLFESNGIKLIVDPYLSDSVEKINPQNSLDGIKYCITLYWITIMIDK